MTTKIPGTRQPLVGLPQIPANLKRPADLEQPGGRPQDQVKRYRNEGQTGQLKNVAHRGGLANIFEPPSKENIDPASAVAKNRAIGERPKLVGRRQHEVPYAPISAHTQELIQQATARHAVPSMPPWVACFGKDRQEFIDSTGKKQGMVTQYPVGDKEVAALFDAAIRRAKPGQARIVNLMQRGNANQPLSYVDKIPTGQVVRVGGLDMRKTPLRLDRQIGTNSSGEPVTHDNVMVEVRYPSDPSGKWHQVRYDHVDGFIDRSAPDVKNFDKICEVLRDPKRDIDSGLVHCHGGIGRSVSYLLRDMGRRHIESENKAGRRVSFEEIVALTEQWITELRALRGPGVMPDSAQYKMVLESLHQLIQQQPPGLREKEPGQLPLQPARDKASAGA